MTEDKNPKEPNAENPYQTLDLKQTKIKDWAAGMSGVKAAFSDLIEEKTLVRGTKALFKMNQAQLVAKKSLKR